MACSRHVVMGDPDFFHIRYGANPHTRNRLGLKKSVDVVKAKDQWHAMKATLEKYDVKVDVIPAFETMPGLVFPANAGYVPRLHQKLPIDQRVVILSTLNSARAKESKVYAKFLKKKLGLRIRTIKRQFEGQADLVSWRGENIFTYGRLIKPQYQINFGIPPWKRLYGFRTDQRALHELHSWITLESSLSLELSNEAFYHGDTVLCPFGKKQEYLLVYFDGLTHSSQDLLKDEANIISLNKRDAEAFAANSFQIIRKGQPVLFMPSGVSVKLRQQIEAKGIEVVPIDVSEFLHKGGGAVKCMLLDLGPSTLKS